MNTRTINPMANIISYLYGISVSLSNLLVYGTFNAPASPNSFCKDIRAHSDTISQKNGSGLDTSVSNGLVVPLVPHLLLVRGPATVFRGIIAIGVLALKGRLPFSVLRNVLFVRLEHIVSKVGKSRPSLTNPNPAPAVVLIAYAFLI